MEQKPTHKGFMFFPDLAEMNSFDKELMCEIYSHIEVEARIIANPKGDNFIFLCDLKNTDEDWGGNFRCFLYKDVPKMLGKFTYLKEANLPQEIIDGIFKMTKKKFTAHGIAFTEGKPQYGFYMEFETIK